MCSRAGADGAQRRSSSRCVVARRRDAVERRSRRQVRRDAGRRRGARAGDGRIEAGRARRARERAVVQASAAAVRVVSKMTAAGESLEDTRRRSSARRRPLVGEAISVPRPAGATSPLRPVADFQFRRTERVHVEWAIAGELDQRAARLLGRNGQPLACR